MRSTGVQVKRDDVVSWRLWENQEEENARKTNNFVGIWILHNYPSSLVFELAVWFTLELFSSSKIVFELYVKIDYYSFKTFSRFWLVKTTRIIHHNQLLFTKFGKNLRHIESMTSKVQPAENYWTDDVKMTPKVQPAADYWTVGRENLGTRLCYFWWAEKQRA